MPATSSAGRTGPWRCAGAPPGWWKRPDDHRGRHRSSTELGTSSASLGVLLVFFISSMIGSWARDPPTARGLPAVRASPAEGSQRAGSGAGRGFTLIASGDVLTHGAVLERA